MKALKESSPVVCAISPGMIDNWLPLIEHHLERGVAETRGELSVDGVIQSIADGDMVPILVVHGSTVLATLVLEISTHQTGKRTIGVAICAGEAMDEWLDEIVDTIDAVGREVNCSEIRITGRRGWSKKLAPYGFQPAYSVVSRDIN